jgi:hypothetical protein
MRTRIFTCNQAGFPYPDVQDGIDQAKNSRSKGDIHRGGWTCSDLENIRVGDKAYFYRVASEPCGFFACGRVVAAEKSHQVKHNHPDFGHLSPAYTDEFYDDDYVKYPKNQFMDEYGHLIVIYEWYSVVDYDKPLLGKPLRASKDFDHYKFLFRKSGQAFGEKFTAKHLLLLDQLWTEHAMKTARQGHGMYTPLPEAA